MDATATIEKIHSGELDIHKLIRTTLSKIETENKRINAVAELINHENDKTLDQLQDKPLKGLPISIKECYAIGGKEITSGSKRMPPIQCKEDAVVVKKLKAAGALVVSRGNTSEFLLGRETDNLVFGTTLSSINTQLTSGGSSGGEGSLVGADCVTIGIGTDIGGSCRYPAVFNGIIGFKPASGQIDKTGIFPIAGNDFTETMNSPGVLCKTVRDARLIYNIIGNKTLNQGNIPSDTHIYTSANFKILVKDNSIKEAIQETISYFKTQKIPVTDLEIPESAELFNHFNALVFEGFTNKIYDWSTTNSGQKLTYFSELIRKWKGKPTVSRELFALLPAFNMMKPSAKKVNKITTRVIELREKYHTLLGKNGVLILPTVGILAPPAGKFYPQYNKPKVIRIITPVSFCNVLNLSCITLPVWKLKRDNKSTPPAIQLISSDGSEELLLNVAENLMDSLNQ